MKHWLKATLAATLLIVTFAAREMVATSKWKYHIYATAVALVFLQNYFEFRPDKRIDKIRKLEWDRRVGDVFHGAIEKLQPGQRLPFRVNVMIERRGIFGPRLRMMYSYGMELTDPDYGLALGWRRGLCWNVYRTGRRGFTDIEKDGNEYHLPRRQTELTYDVKAVICLPIRSAQVGDGGAISHRAVAVLNIDAISSLAAAELRDYWRVIEQNQRHPLLDLAGYAGLYF